MTKHRQFTGLAEPVWLVLVAPLLLFPGRFPRWLVAAALLSLFAPSLWRWWRAGRPSRPFPLQLPLLALLLVALPVALWVTPLFWEATWEKLASLLWSLAVFLAVVNSSLPTAALAGAFFALGAAFAVVGLLGMDVVAKVPGVAPLAGRLAAVATLDGFHPNQVAGTITLFAPPAFALALAALDHRLSRAQFHPAYRIGAPLVAVALALVLLLTQSRGGWLGYFAGVAVIMLLAGPLARRLLPLTAVGGLAFLVLTPWGQAIGRSLLVTARLWRYATPGSRLPIWQRAVAALTDFPLSGVGLGAFRHVMNALYPYTPAVKEGQPPPEPIDFAHAHNIWLQTTLDLGLVGGVAFTTILLIALACLVVLIRRSRPGGLRRYWLLGLLGGLVANLVYGATDALVLGAKPGVSLWFLLGLVMVAWGTRPFPRPLATRSGQVVVTAVGLGLLLLSFTPLGARNVVARSAARAVMAEPATRATAVAALEALAGSQCRANYLLGVVHHAAGNADRRDAAWRRLLDCSPGEIPLLQTILPEDVPLADYARQQHPSVAAAHFWAADTLAASDPAAAAAAYRAGLALAPEDGRRWADLGHLLKEDDPAAALQAFLHSCYNGDPPGGGCRAAGQLAAQRGDVAAAINYYRLSYRSTTLRLADDLERTGRAGEPGAADK